MEVSATFYQWQECINEDVSRRRRLVKFLVKLGAYNRREFFDTWRKDAKGRAVTRRLLSRIQTDGRRKRLYVALAMWVHATVDRYATHSGGGLSILLHTESTADPSLPCLAAPHCASVAAKLSCTSRH